MSERQWAAWQKLLHEYRRGLLCYSEFHEELEEIMQGK